MSDHQRAVIRSALVTLLAGGSTLAGARVIDHPTKPRTTLPALTVEDLGEEQTPVTPGGGANRKIQRVLVLEVTAEVQKTGDYARERDELCGQVEALVATAAGLIAGVDRIVPAGYATDIYSEGEKPIAIGRQRFRISYLTTQGNPAATL